MSLWDIVSLIRLHNNIRLAAVYTGPFIFSHYVENKPG